MVSALNLTKSFSLSPDNILELNGTLARGLVADSQQNMFPFRNASRPLGMRFFDEVTLAGWGDCGGSYLRGPTGNCWWDGTANAAVGDCQVQLDYNISAPPSPPGGQCPDVPWPFSYDLATAYGSEFVVQCIGGRIYLPSNDVWITGFGDGNITIDKKMTSLVSGWRCWGA